MNDSLKLQDVPETGQRGEPLVVTLVAAANSPSCLTSGAVLPTCTEQADRAGASVLTSRRVGGLAAP